jgi:hypothetical protein
VQVGISRLAQDLATGAPGMYVDDGFMSLVFSQDFGDFHFCPALHLSLGQHESSGNEAGWFLLLSFGFWMVGVGFEGSAE